MKTPDAADVLVVLFFLGLVCVIKGTAMLSLAWAWIVPGAALMAWSTWRLR
jgi:hypothetical protein